MNNKFALQLWSIKDYIENDFFGTLSKVAELGYKGVEFAGYGNISAEDMSTQLKNLGLEAVSSHVSLESLQNNLDYEIDYLSVLGAKNITCPYSDMDNIEKAKRCAEILNKVGEKTSKLGITLSYHNHAHEFKIDNGEYPLEVFFANVDKNFVKQEPDVFWVAVAGLDPIEYIKNHIDRCPLIHLKQLKALGTEDSIDAGNGIIDFKTIIDIATNSKFIYEQESWDKDGMIEVEKSIKYLLSL